MSLKKKFNPFTGNFDIYNDVTVLKFKEGVATQADLPSSGNEKNDARITNDNHHLYVWDGTQWVDQGDIFNIKWDSIENKPTSSTSDIDDAVSKKHSQNTDKILLAGGETIDQQQPNAVGEDVKVGDGEGLAQTFTAGKTGQLTKVKFYAYRYTYDNDRDLIVEIRTTDENGKPTTTVLASETISYSNFPKNTWIHYTLTFSNPTSITSGTKYALVFRTSQSDGYYFLKDDGNNNSYPDGEYLYSEYGQENWTTWNNYDIYFIIYVTTEDSELINNGILKNNLSVEDGKTIDGRDISADGTKLDNIEENAVSLNTVKSDSEVADAISKRHSQNTDSKIKNADGDTSVETTDSDEIVFKNAGNEVLRILSSGVAKYYNTNRDISDLYHLVDKKYVDEAVTSLGARYYMLDTDSGISDYKLCSTTPSAGSEQSISKNDLTNDQYVIGWISPNTNEPDKLIAGVYNWRIYAEKTGSGTKTLRLYWKLIERKSDNSEVVIGTSVVSNEIVTGKNSYIIPLTLSADYDIASDSYMVGKIYAEVSGSGNDPSIILYYEGNSDSHWKIPVNTEILDGIYVKKTDSIDELGDVNISSPADGEVLTYNSTSGKWENQTGGSSSKIQDADGDTLLDTEETADKDEIVGKVAGVEALRIYNSGIVDFPKQSGCSVYRNSDFTLSSGDANRMVCPYDTKESDIQNEFDTSTHRFTATKAGRFLIVAQWNGYPLIDKRCDIHIRKNGTSVREMEQVTGHEYDRVRIVGIVDLAANDYIDIYIGQWSGADITVVGTRYLTFLDIQKVS